MRPGRRLTGPVKSITKKTELAEANDKFMQALTMN